MFQPVEDYELLQTLRNIKSLRYLLEYNYYDGEHNTYISNSRRIRIVNGSDI